MSNANVGLVQSLYAAFQRGEIATIIGTMAPGSTWEVVGRASDFPTLGPRQGAEGVRSFFETVGQHLKFLEFAPQEFYAVDDKIFVLGHYSMTVTTTGKSISSDWIHVFAIRDGKVTAFREFTDTAQAAEAYRA